MLPLHPACDVKYVRWPLLQVVHRSAFGSSRKPRKPGDGKLKLSMMWTFAVTQWPS